MLYMSHTTIGCCRVMDFGFEADIAADEGVFGIR